MNIIFLRGGYTLTITDHHDADFRKYLQRRANQDNIEAASTELDDASPLDISLDDIEGDVVAGISAATRGDCLHIDCLWVEDSLRGRGVGRQLVTLAEAIAAERGCKHVRLHLTGSPDFYLKLGYTVTGRLQQFPDGDTICWLTKSIPQAPAAVEIKDLA